MASYQLPVTCRYYSFVTPTRFFIALVLLVSLAACNGNHPPRIGETAPDFTVNGLQKAITLSQLRGKPVLLNFWASWCGPCVEEMPSLVQLQKVLGDRVTILAVSIDSDENAYKQFVRDHNIDLLTAWDPRKVSSDLYGTFKYPETYVIDRNGKIVRKFIGAVDWTNPEIVDYLSKL